MMLASRVSSFIAATYIMSIYTDTRYLIKKVSVTGRRRRPIGKMGNGRLLAEAKSPIGTRVGTNGELDQGLLCQGCDCVCWSLGIGDENWVDGYRGVWWTVDFSSGMVTHHLVSRTKSLVAFDQPE